MKASKSGQKEEDFVILCTVYSMNRWCFLQGELFLKSSLLWWARKNPIFFESRKPYTQYSTSKVYFFLWRLDLLPFPVLLLHNADNHRLWGFCGTTTRQCLGKKAWVCGLCTFLHHVWFGNHCSPAQFNGAQIHDYEYRGWKTRWSTSTCGKYSSPSNFWNIVHNWWLFNDNTLCSLYLIVFANKFANFEND